MLLYFQRNSNIHVKYCKHLWTIRMDQKWKVILDVLVPPEFQIWEREKSIAGFIMCFRSIFFCFAVLQFCRLTNWTCVHILNQIKLQNWPSLDCYFPTANYMFFFSKNLFLLHFNFLSIFLVFFILEYIFVQSPFILVFYFMFILFLKILS